MALPVDIVRIIKDLQRRVLNLESSPQPPNINLSNDATATFSLSSNSWTLLTVTLADTGGARLLAQPIWSLFKDNSATGTKYYPTGDDWTYDQVVGLRVHSWIDWGVSNNNNMIFQLLVINEGPDDLTNLLFIINWRYLSREVSTS